MRYNFKQKAIYIWFFLIMVTFVIIHKTIFSTVNYELISKWIRISISILTEISTLGVLLSFIFLDIDKKYRLGLVVSIIFLGFGRYYVNVTTLLISILSIIAITGFKFSQSAQRNRIDYFKYSLTFILSLCYYLYKLNIGSKTIIEMFYIITIVSFTTLAFIYIRYYLPDTKNIKNEFKLEKINTNGAGTIATIFAICILLSASFNIFLSDKIIDYKYNRLKEIQIKHYYDNQYLFQSAFNELNSLPHIPLLEFNGQNITLTIQDTTTTDSLKTIYLFSSIVSDENLYPIYYGEDYYSISGIDFIDSNNVSVILPDTSLTFKHNWSFYASEKDINDPIVQKMLQYVNLNQDKIVKIHELLKTVDCYAFSKDTEGNIFLYYDKIVLENFGYILLESNLPVELNDGIYEKLNNSVYWFHYEFCCIDLIGSYYMNRYNI